MASKGGKKKKGKKGKQTTPTSAPKQSDAEPKPTSPPASAPTPASKPTLAPKPIPEKQPQPQEVEEDDEEMEESEEPSEKKKKNKKKKKKKKKSGATPASPTTPASAPVSPPKDDKQKAKGRGSKSQPKPQQQPQAPPAKPSEPRGSVSDEEKMKQLQEILQKLSQGHDMKNFDRNAIKDAIKDNMEYLKRSVLPTATFKPVHLTPKERSEKKDIWKQKYHESAAQVGMFMRQRTPDSKEDTERLVSDLKRLVDEHNPDPPQPPMELQQALSDSSVALFSSRDAQYWRIVPFESDWRIEIYISSGRRFDCPAPLKPYEKKIKIIPTGIPEIPL